MLTCKTKQLNIFGIKALLLKEYDKTIFLDKKERYSKKKIAKSLGISPSTLNRIEDTGTITEKVMDSICVRFKLSSPKEFYEIAEKSSARMNSSRSPRIAPNENKKSHSPSSFHCN